MSPVVYGLSPRLNIIVILEYIMKRLYLVAQSLSSNSSLSELKFHHLYLAVCVIVLSRGGMCQIILSAG